MAKTKEELIEMIENGLVDSTSNKITGDNVKNVMLEMVETIAENASSGGGTMEYWTIPSEIAEEFTELAAFVLLVKAQLDGVVMIASSIAAAFGTPTAMGWDPNAKMYSKGNFITAQEVLQGLGGSSWADWGFTQLTEEEFYTV